MEFRIGDGIVAESNLEILLLQPPRVGVAIYTVAAKCNMHPDCWIATCSVQFLHTSDGNHYVVVNREGDRTIEMNLHERQMAMVAKYLVEIMKKNLDDIRKVADLALAQAESLTASRGRQSIESETKVGAGWEYMFDRIFETGEELEKQLRQRDAEGWELVSYTYSGGSISGHYMIFRR